MIAPVLRLTGTQSCAMKTPALCNFFTGSEGVTPIFMDEEDRLSQGVPQEAAIQLRRETYPDQLNITFTRGFVSSQAFVEKFQKFGTIDTLLPKAAKDGLTFKATHPKKDEALAWMGFEARETILGLLDQAINEKAEVRVVAYDLSQPEVVGRFAKLKTKLKIIIDDSKEHGEADSGETQSAERLKKTAGTANVKRQHMKRLQHNKMIIVSGPRTKKVVFGSTNLSWRGLYVQANNTLVVEGKKPWTSRSLRSTTTSTKKTRSTKPTRPS
jgi:hypothetical protein